MLITIVEKNCGANAEIGYLEVKNGIAAKYFLDKNRNTL